MLPKSIFFLPHAGSCFIAYLLFFASFIIALIYVTTKKEKMVLVIDKLTAAGFMFFTSGIMLGSVWAEQAWGSFWSWDPKETWSLVVWFMYACYLIGRFVIAGSIKSCLVFNFIGFGGVIFNFFLVSRLFAGLHTYLH